LIVVVGAPDGKSLVALNKTTGDLVWSSLDDQGGYATPLLLEVDGLQQLAVLTGEAIVGVALKDGQELWRHPWKTSEDANVATPIFHDGKLFVSSGYGTGCALFELSAENGKASANQLWASKRMKNYFSSSVLYEGHLYGFNNNRLACMEFDSGDALWQERGFNRGSLLIADDLMFILGERGTLALAQPNADKYEELASVKGIIEPKTWTIPTIANGKIYLRNEQEMVCLQVAAE
jgi:outer membrane protein assembly factor BamB